MLIFAIRVLLLAFYRFNEIDEQEDCPGFIVLEEDIADDEDIVIDRYLDYSLYIMKWKGI